MDSELKSTSVLSPRSEADDGTDPDDVEILSNVLESLDASEGAPGPVRTILHEQRESIGDT